MQRVVELGNIAVLKINAVVVLLPQNLQRRDGLQRAETVAQGKLIEGVCLKIRHEFPAENAARVRLRKLRECPPFADGQGFVRL